MASQKVHGITIDLDVNTSGVSEAFKDINRSLTGTTRELKQVDNLLKNDANNVTLLTQKQNLLTDAIDKTTSKLAQLGRAKAENEKSGEVDKQSLQYRELERDIEKTKKQLEGLIDQQKQNTKELNNAKRGIDNVSESLDNASGSAVSFGDILKANILSDLFIEGIKKMADAVKEFAGELHEWAEGYRELEVYEKQFESNLKNTAGASDEQIKSLKKLAKQKERSGVISSKAITSAYQELATYVESADAIEGLTDALTDMAAQQYGVDATDESVRNLATTLGKALANGDYSGLTRLGYGFDEVQQKIMKTGDELDRVAVLNDVIESSIGGVNEALAQTDAGKIFEVSSYFDDMKESIGEVVSAIEVGFVEQIMPILQPFIEEVVQWFIDNKDLLLETVTQLIEWLTSDDMVAFFESVTNLVDQLLQVIDELVEISEKIGIVKTAIDLLKGAVDLLAGALEIVLGLFEQIKGIASSSFWNNGVDFSGISSYYYGGSGGYGALNSGGFASGGISLNANFNVNANNVTKADVQNWASWLADGINEELGRRIQ